MIMRLRVTALLAGCLMLATGGHCAFGEDSDGLPRATIDGTGLGWRELGEDDFVDVNGDEETWTFEDGVIHCTGQPIGVIRTAKEYGNFELVAQWRHLESGGNSGIFVWASPEAA